MIKNGQVKKGLLILRRSDGTLKMYSINTDGRLLTIILVPGNDGNYVIQSATVHYTGIRYKGL